MLQTDELAKRELQAIREVLIAVLVCPDLYQMIFDKHMGISHEWMKRVLRAWPPKQVERNDATDVAVRGCLREVCYANTFEHNAGYPGLPPEDWHKWFSMSKAELRALNDRWNRDE